MSECKVRYKFGAMEFEVEGDPQIVERERKVFLETLPSIAIIPSYKDSLEENKEDKLEFLPEGINNENVLINKQSSCNINTFIRDKGFVSDFDKTMGFAYFMQEYDNVDCFDSNSIKEKMKEAKTLVPNNISLAFISMTQKGFIQQKGKADKGMFRYYLTDKGKDYVENYVKKDRKKGTTKRISSKIKESQYNKLTRENLSLEKYPDINKLKSNKDKIMLMMYILAEEKKGEEYTINDVIFVMSNIFREKVTRGVVKGLFNNKATSSLFNKENVNGKKKDVKYKLLAKGDSYVRDNIIKINDKTSKN